MFTRCLFEDEVEPPRSQSSTPSHPRVVAAITPAESIEASLIIPPPPKSSSSPDIPSIISSTTHNNRPHQKRKRSIGDDKEVIQPPGQTHLPDRDRVKERDVKRTRRSRSELDNTMIGCCGAIVSSLSTSGHQARYDHFMTAEASKHLLDDYNDHVLKNRSRTISTLADFHNDSDTFDDVSIQKTVQRNHDSHESLGQCIVCSCVTKTVFLLMIRNRLPCYCETNANQNNINAHSHPTCYFLKNLEWIRQKKGEFSVAQSLRNYCDDHIIPSEKEIKVSSSDNNSGIMNPLPLGVTSAAAASFSIPSDPVTNIPKHVDNCGTDADHRHTVKTHVKDSDNPGVYHGDGLSIGYIAPEWTSAKVSAKNYIVLYNECLNLFSPSGRQELTFLDISSVPVRSDSSKPLLP
jgi:hypothetical protein